jgi:ATP-dependent RNA helicase DHX8/PRP22
LGDILVFLTGEEEIQRACRLLGQKVDSLDAKGVEMPDIAILAAYASLSATLQSQIFQEAPPNCRKVIFSTNICETSLTVDGVVYVIDCGFVKQRRFNPVTGMDALVIVPISQVQAVQRTGRAGRTREGQCIRLYSKEAFEMDMPPQTEPEIKRTNLANTVLLLKVFR